MTPQLLSWVVALAGVALHLACSERSDAASTDGGRESAGTAGTSGEAAVSSAGVSGGGDGVTGGGAAARSGEGSFAHCEFGPD